MQEQKLNFFIYFAKAKFRRIQRPRTSQTCPQWTPAFRATGFRVTFSSKFSRSANGRRKTIRAPAQASYAGNIADFSEQTGLCRTGRQGGRNGDVAKCRRRRGRDAGSGTFRRSPRRFFCVQFGFDFRMRHFHQSSHEVGEDSRIAHDFLGRDGWAFRHGSLRIVRKQILWLLALGINRFDWL